MRSWLASCALLLASCAHAPRAVGPAEVVTVGPARPLLVPAADGLRPWVLRVEGGRVLRVRDAGLEDVSARYGVADLAVTGLCALDGGAVFFGAHDTVVVHDGVARRWPIGGAVTACGGTNVARSDGRAVVLYDLGQGAWTRYAMKGPIAIDGAGVLWVARGALLYRAQRDALVLAYDAGARIDALKNVDGRLVLRQRDALSRFDGTRRVPLRGAHGDELERVVFGVPAASPFDALTPIIEHSCGTCHVYGGRGGFALTTEPLWAQYRDPIRARVIEEGNMPPKGAGAAVQLTETERETIRRWLDATGQR